MPYAIKIIKFRNKGTTNSKSMSLWDNDDYATWICMQYAQKYDENERFSTNFCPTTYSWLFFACIIMYMNREHIVHSFSASILKVLHAEKKNWNNKQQHRTIFIQIVCCLNLLIWPQFFFTLSFQSESANSKWIQMWIDALLQRLLIFILKFTFSICLLTHSALTIHIVWVPNITIVVWKIYTIFSVRNLCLQSD